MRTRVIGVVLLLCAVAGVALAASRMPRVLPPRVVPPHPSVKGGALEAFARRLMVRPGSTYRALTVYPVVATGVEVPGVDLTLDEAVNKDLMAVDELSDSDVNRLLVISHAKEPVFIMSGEMLRGGKQDRIISDDLVMPARAKLEVTVYCVEHGRWAVDEDRRWPGRGRGTGGGGGMGGGGRGAFSAGHSLAGSGVRAAGGMGGGGGRGGGGGLARRQSEVWSKVADEQRALGAPSTTGALRSVHDSPTVLKRMRPYQDAFAAFLRDNPQASGVVVLVDGRILAADLFSSRAMFQHMWPQLLEAYVIDALEQTDSDAPRRYRSGPGQAAVEDWLRGLGSVSRSPQRTPGEGRLYLLQGERLAGSALVWQDGLVHAALFPEGSVRIPEEEPRYNPQDFRRNRLHR